MGRDLQPPELADSWDEFHARIERESDAGSHWLGLWWTVGALLFGGGLIISAYALSDHHWWLWLAMLAPLAIDGVLASRALERADRRRAHAAEIERLENAWLVHLELARRSLAS